MTTATTASGPATRFLVDGQEYGGGPLTFAYERSAVVVFSADPDEVARLLPSPRLHPVHWFTGRAMVVVVAGDEVMTIGDLPPVRYASFYVTALVTYGHSKAMPVLPLAGPLLPRVGSIIDRRYRVGLLNLAVVTTNRVAAEVLRLVYGQPAQVAAIREDRSPTRLRFTATDPGGAPIVSLEVPADGEATPVDQGACSYVVADSQLLRVTYSTAGSQFVRVGGSAARLRLGQHPLADQLRGIGLSPRPLLAMVQRSYSETVDRPAERLAPAQAIPPPPTAADPVEAPMVICHEDGREETVDQLLDGLPFDPAGFFDHPAS